MTNTLDYEDKEILQGILVKIYPNDNNFLKYEPTINTLEIFISALKRLDFCNSAMTSLLAGIVTGGARHFYKGPMKSLVKKLLKEAKKNFENKSVSFYICEKTIKLSNRSAFLNSLKGYLTGPAS